MTICTDPNLKVFFDFQNLDDLVLLLVVQCRILLHDGYVMVYWKQALGLFDPSHCSAEQDRLVWPVASEKHVPKMKDIDGH
jgi:hypothetical protein